MFKAIGIIVALAIAAVLVFAATKPDVFRVERSARISAPPEKIFALLNDFHNWTSWSPWEKKDPAMKRTYSGPNQGQGAHYAWEGDHEVGQGSMTITESQAPQRLSINLDFIKPFEGHNVVVFTLQPQEKETQVNWSMQGPIPYFAKIIHVFINMDKMVGKDFESGLANLKAAAEK